MAPHALNNGITPSSDQVNGSKQQCDYAFDPKLTPSVMNATGPKADQRLREVFANLVSHLHAFLRESRVTRVEYEAALRMVRPQSSNCCLSPY